MSDQKFAHHRPFLNVGCGDVFHPAWTNIDLHPASPIVQRRDVRAGLPYPNASFTAVYHSHVLEHMTKEAAYELMNECARVLVPGGTLRVVVPDLETICRTYLEKFEAVIRAERAAEKDYDWMLLELYDQAVRTHSGGEMVEFLKSPDLPNELFIRERIGHDLVDSVRASIRRPNDSSKNSRTFRSIVQSVKKRASSSMQRLVISSVLGVGGPRIVEEIRFRQSGEIHHWMYDRFSLARLMENIGLIHVATVDALTSSIPSFAEWELDAKAGIVRKPDSLFVEAIKPPSERVP